MINIKRINPKHFWYIIGYIVTDGNLSPDGRHVCITSKDIGHLFKLRSALHLKSSIGRKASSSSQEKIYGVLQFSDVNFYRYLQQINIGPCKSLIQGKVLIDMNYFGDFIRGVIDGDGCIYSWKHRSNSHTQWSLRIVSASTIFIAWLKEIIDGKYKVRGRIYTRKDKGRNPIHLLKYGKIAGQIILNEIYYKDCLCLDRKLVTVQACLRDTSKMLNYGSVICSGGETGYTRET